MPPGLESFALRLTFTIFAQIYIMYMILAIFGFLQLSIADILDMFLLAILIYFIFRWIRGTSAMSIFVAIISLYAIRLIVSSFNMRLMTNIMETVTNVGIIALIIIFQPEIRKFLMQLGTRYMHTAQGNRIVTRFFRKGSKNTKVANSEAINNLCEACRRMAEDKTGALIVIAHNANLEEIINTGDSFDATIHRRLILNIFFKNSPLHDGALVISGGRIVAGRCTLPITEKKDIPASLGMRHKAAIGITEATDATVVVVSEETGRISYVKEGNVTPITNINELKLLLNRDGI